MIKLNSIDILDVKTREQFINSLRKVKLFGDDKIYPYKNAFIETRLINPEEVAPISRYALSRHVNIQQQLHSLFQKQGIDTLNLGDKNSDIKYVVENERNEWLMSPPIVEESEIDGGKAILIDGEHRFLLARELKQKVRVAWISKVPKIFPPVAIPLSWKDVTMHETVPILEYKREYRYKKLEDFPDISSFSNAVINKDNFRYFFYRDLSPVCTSGIRPIGSNSKPPTKP